MKVQHTAVYAYDKNDRMITFERFTKKTLVGVLNQYRKINDGSRLSEFFFKSYRAADVVQVWKTEPDGKVSELIGEYSGQEFMAAISA